MPSVDGRGEIREPPSMRRGRLLRTSDICYTSFTAVCGSCRAKRPSPFCGATTRPLHSTKQSCSSTRPSRRKSATIRYIRYYKVHAAFDVCGRFVYLEVDLSFHRTAVTHPRTPSGMHVWTDRDNSHARARPTNSQNYLSTPEIRLYGVVGATEIDGRRDLHAHLAFEHASAPGGLVMPLGRTRVCVLCICACVWCCVCGCFCG